MIIPHPIASAKAHFASQFKLIASIITTGQDFTFLFSEFMLILSHPVSIRGAYRDRHDTRGGDAVAVVHQALWRDDWWGADGEIVWSWHPDADAKPR